MTANRGTVTANGELRKIELPCSISTFLESSGWRATQVVVELNGRVLLRRELQETQLNDGDRIEVVIPVAGG